jgi:pimeloyl-ACP methyl ester carboxylesterase
MAVLTAAAACIAFLYGFTILQTWRIGQLHPPVGEFVDVGGYRLHCVHVEGPPEADLPAIVFIHGASGNLLDQALMFHQTFEGRAEMLFVDRPGHGWSDRGGPENARPDGQARAIAALMKARGMDRAIIAGHSFGGAVALSLALEKPECVSGLLLISAPSHPWPEGIDFYYRLTTTPGLGHVFAHLLAMPAGLAVMQRAIGNVFHPNAPMPHYAERSAVKLVLRPRQFLANARDVANLFDHFVRSAPHYRSIDVPTVIVTGTDDDIVIFRNHSIALAEDIEHADLVCLDAIGHKPDYAANSVCVAAIEKLAGQPVDLEAAVRRYRAERIRIEAGSQAEPAGAETGQIPLRPSEPI